MAEIAFVISLASADSGVSQAAAMGLRVLAQTDSPPLSPVDDMEDRQARNSIYEELGDPNVVVVGTCRIYSPNERVRNCLRARRAPKTHSKTCPFGCASFCNSYCNLGRVFLAVACGVGGPYRITNGFG